MRTGYSKYLNKLTYNLNAPLPRLPPIHYLSHAHKYCVRCTDIEQKGFQNPKLSNKLFASGSSNTFSGGESKPRMICGTGAPDPGLGRSSTTRLLLRLSIFCGRSGMLGFRMWWRCLAELGCCWSWGWVRNSQFRTVRYWKKRWRISI